jgi:hypothetical protein
MITDYEKNIYNIFLVVSRKVKNKPVRHRQDFTNLPPNIYCALKKIAALLQRNTNITPREFFTAPYQYYGEEEYFSLDFYTTTKAIKCYTLYVEQQERNDPDNIDIIERCKECCKFIYGFCKQNNITLTEYKLLINGTTPIILQHLKDHKINFYTIHGLNCESVFKGVEIDLLNFFIKDFNSVLSETRLKFQKSIKLKVILRKALNIIEVELLKK